MGSLLSVGLGFQAELDKGIVSEQLRQQFVRKGILLSEYVRVMTKKKYDRWRIVDEGHNQTYVVKRNRQDKSKLNIYRTDPIMLELLRHPIFVGCAGTAAAGMIIFFARFFLKDLFVNIFYKKIEDYPIYCTSESYPKCNKLHTDLYIINLTDKEQKKEDLEKFLERIFGKDSKHTNTSIEIYNDYPKHPIDTISPDEDFNKNKGKCEKPNDNNGKWEIILKAINRGCILKFNLEHGGTGYPSRFKKRGAGTAIEVKYPRDR